MAKMSGKSSGEEPKWKSSKPIPNPIGTQIRYGGIIHTCVASGKR